MPYRVVIAVVAMAVLLAACSATKGLQLPSSGASSPKASASASSPSSSTPSESSSTESTSPTSVGAQGCIDLGTASYQLGTSTTKEDLRKAADTMEKYNPPADVKAAIEHIVDAGGFHENDPDLESNTTLITEWIGKACLS